MSFEVIYTYILKCHHFLGFSPFIFLKYQLAPQNEWSFSQDPFYFRSVATKLLLCLIWASLVRSRSNCSFLDFSEEKSKWPQWFTKITGGEGKVELPPDFRTWKMSTGFLNPVIQIAFVTIMISKVLVIQKRIKPRAYLGQRNALCYLYLEMGCLNSGNFLATYPDKNDAAPWDTDSRRAREIHAFLTQRCCLAPVSYPMPWGQGLPFHVLSMSLSKPETIMKCFKGIVVGDPFRCNWKKLQTN